MGALEYWKTLPVLRLGSAQTVNETFSIPNLSPCGVSKGDRLLFTNLTKHMNLFQQPVKL